MQAPRGVIENSLDLLACDAGKPFQKLIDGRAAFDVLEQGVHRHARASKYPGATKLAGNALHSETL